MPPACKDCPFSTTKANHNHGKPSSCTAYRLLIGRIGSRAIPETTLHIVVLNGMKMLQEKDLRKIVIAFMFPEASAEW